MNEYLVSITHPMTDRTQKIMAHSEVDAWHRMHKLLKINEFIVSTKLLRRGVVPYDMAQGICNA